MRWLMMLGVLLLSLSTRASAQDSERIGFVSVGPGGHLTLSNRGAGPDQRRGTADDIQLAAFQTDYLELFSRESLLVLDAPPSPFATAESNRFGIIFSGVANCELPFGGCLLAIDRDIPIAARYLGSDADLAAGDFVAGLDLSRLSVERVIPEPDSSGIGIFLAWFFWSRRARR